MVGPHRVSRIVMTLADGSTIEADRGSLAIEAEYLEDRVMPVLDSVGVSRWRFVMDLEPNAHGNSWHQVAPRVTRESLGVDA